MRNLYTHALLLIGCWFITSCSPWAKIAKTELAGKEGLQTAHLGVLVVDADNNKTLCDYQSEKLFIPASNTKLLGMYAGMKLLGDSLPGIRYAETEDSIYLQGTGDPTLLHPDFNRQPVVEFLQRTGKEIVISDANWEGKIFGYGWPWDDFNSGYAPERSVLPVYGNVIKWTQVIEKTDDENGKAEDQAFVYSEPEVNWKVRFSAGNSKQFSVTRDRNENFFYVTEGKEMLRSIHVPFVTNGVLSALDLMRDSIGKTILYVPAETVRRADKLLRSQPTDSLYARMMHESDNFFAEQNILMLSDQLLGKLDSDKAIDTLARLFFSDMPQQPRWADGSGLSRYNLFSPADFVWLLRKMKAEFTEQRLFAILPAGNEGTLKGLYKEIGNNLHAKTGTLSGQLALSGYLTTQKGHHLVFSVLVNNHSGSAAAVRKQLENFLLKFYHNY